ncbi:DNA primase [Rubrivivax sp. A210]|uniref:DNA primase n=1 Tax=Rubrivivax sp. A210 TaxID=2772301 RepID=UPI001917B427|nr:DNA primase [Rubrivivax sp. A210]CAD5367220.1 DNA primase [Rubrivivax sp. A210]
MIPPGFVQELLSRVDVVDVVGRHVELKRGGANLMGLCPFHAEKSPSFSVNPAKQFYYCFGCGAGGDAIRFLTEHLGLSFVEAVRDLAQGAGMQVPEEEVSPAERERRDTLRQRRHTMGELLERAAVFYRGQLRGAAGAVDYLKRRGLTGAIAARFGLGYAPPGWHTLAGVFANYDDPLLEEAGLVRAREDDGEAPAKDRSRWDWFRDRIIFPIRGVGGEVIGFGGRVLDDGKPKYINSPETPLFSKGRELYGLFEARQAVREKGCVLVVEGYMDVVALAQNGFANAVATLGTACTADHVQKLFRFTDAVVFSFDGDAAGRRAAGRALEAALPHASDLRSVRFLFLPPEHDPDSYVRELGAAAFEQALAEAVPLSLQLIEQAAEGADLATAEGRARMLAQAKPLWQALPDGALKRQLLPELARRAQLELSDLQALWGEKPAPVKPPERQGPLRLIRRGSLRMAPAGPADIAVRLLLQHADWWDQLDGDDRQMLHELGGVHGDIVRWLERDIEDHGPRTWATLNTALEDEPFADPARAWVRAGLGDEDYKLDGLQQVVAELWRELLKQEADAIAAAAPTAEDLQRYKAIMEQIAAIKTTRLHRPR